MSAGSQSGDNGISLSVRLQGHTVVYGSVKETLEIPLSEVKLIAEATSVPGLALDDWHLILAGADCWYEISAYANGFETFLRSLSNYLGYGLELTLFNSVEFRSRVLWPAELREQPCFDYSTRFLGFVVDLDYAPEVREFLNSSTP